MKYLLLLLLLIPTAAIAQNAKIDSLKRVIETTKVDTVKGRTLCRLCNELRKVGKYEEGLAAGERGIRVNKKTKDRKWEENCMNSLGNIHQNTGNYLKALNYLKCSISICIDIEDQAGIAKNLNNIGNVYYVQGDFLHALESYHQCMEINYKIGNRNGVAACLGNIGLVYWNQGDYINALEYQQRSLKIEEELGNNHGVAVSLSNIGNIYQEQGDYAQALGCYERSLQIEKNTGNQANVASCLNNIGLIYRIIGNYARALDCHQRSLSIREKIGDKEGVAESHGNIGIIHYSQGNYASAVDMFHLSLKIREDIGDRAGVAACLSNIGGAYHSLGKMVAARSFAQRGLTMAQRIGHLKYKQLGAEVLYRADSALGNWKSAFDAARLYHVYSDSMKNDEQSKELGRLESKAEYDKQTEIDRIKNEEEKGRERERFTWMLGSAGGGLLLLLVIAFTLFRGRQKEQKANAALRTLNEEIQQQKGEIEAINAELQTTLQEVSIQKQEIEEQHAKIEDSIRYASRIQHAILPSNMQMAESLPPHFIHYQPRDIVSGDFYWMTQRQGKTFFAAVDCTGHGVPGAFMSVLGSNLLHQIVDENHITEPDVILAELDRRIAATLRQQFGGDSKDGMDLALVVLHEPDAAGKRTVEYTGAGRPLWVWSNGEITEYKSAKYSCGGSQHEDKQYPAHCVEVSAGDRLFIFSDGPVDQFGGPKGRKLGSTQLQAFLSETANLPIEEQGVAFAAFFNDWMSAKKQLDDVLLAGVAV